MNIFLKFLWSKKSYVIIILISVILISILAIKLYYKKKALINLNNEIAQNYEVQKLNENIYSQLVFLIEDLDPSKEIKEYIKGDPIVELKTKYIIKKVGVSVPSTSDNEVSSIDEVFCVESKKTFNYSDSFQDLKGTVSKVETLLDIKYKPLTIETVISEKDGLYKAYHNTNNKDLIVESSSVRMDKSTFKRNKNNILNASLNYNLNKFTMENKYAGIGVEYIRIFDAIPITVGVNYNIDLDGNNRVGVLLGGRF